MPLDLFICFACSLQSAKYFATVERFLFVSCALRWTQVFYMQEAFRALVSSYLSGLPPVERRATGCRDHLRAIMP